MRLRLAQAAALGNPMFTVSRLEIDRVGPSYTVDTLRELSHRYPGSSLHLLIGADQLAAMDTWHEPTADRAARAARGGPAAGHRRRARRRRRTSTGSRCRRSASPRRSSARGCAQGRPIRYFVPDAVRELIEAEGLYRDDVIEPADPS